MVYFKKYTGQLVITFFILFTIFAIIQNPMPALATTDDVETWEDFDDFYTDLNGEWYFIPESFVSVTEVKQHESDDIGMNVQLPSSFATQIDKDNSYGTYYKQVKIPSDFIGRTLAIHVPYQYSAYTLFVNETELIKAGTVGHDSESHRAEMAPRTGYFIPKDNALEIVMHISSFDHIRGGAENRMFIGNAELVTSKFMTKINLDLFMISALIIIGTFTLSFTILRREEKGFMFFALFCYLIAIRGFFSDPFYYTVIFPDMSWLWGTRMEYFLSLVCSWIFVILLKSWYPKSFSKKVVILLTIILLPTAVITLFTQPVFFQALFFKVALFALPTGIYFIYLTYKEIKLHNNRAKINAVGLIIVFLAFLNDFAQGINLYEFQPMMLTATAIYVLLHLVQMSIEYARLNETLEEVNEALVTLNASLDEEVYDRTIELEKVNERLEKQAMLDSLTGIANRRSFNLYLREAFMTAKKTGEPLSILMLDVDEFKKYNDYFGHGKGDIILKELTKTAQEQLSNDSFFARYGGEEFSIILPKTQMEEAYAVAEKVRRAIESKAYLHPEGKQGVLTCSIGVATLTPEKTYENENKLVDAADARMYEAKQSGRNLVK